MNKSTVEDLSILQHLNNVIVKIVSIKREQLKNDITQYDTQLIDRNSNWMHRYCMHGSEVW